MSYINLTDEYKKILFYNDGFIQTPFYNRIQIIYADFIASGKPCPYIENYIIQKVYPYYSNTHSNAYNGIYMKKLIDMSKRYIRKSFNLKDEHKIIFTGTGTTSAINHLINLIEYSSYDNVYIYITIYEHYSNHLPWIELCKKYKNIKLYIMPVDDETYENDYEWLLENIKKYNNNNDLLIVSCIACSNVTGKLFNLNNLCKIIRSICKIKSYIFGDYACNAPYSFIDGSCMDALFFSPHKFIGGVGTPGVLIAKEELFMKRQPYCAGGGCVVKVKDDKIEYEFDIEKRETAGTPNIIGIIKVWLSLQIKNGLKKVIVKNEEYMIKELEDLEKELEKINKDFYRVMYNKKYKYLPIFSFGIKGIHFNLLVILLNDKYGIQSRGGISCCGLLADYVESKIGCRGWCRVTFHWSMTLDEIEYIKNGIIDIVKNIEIYKKLYSYDENTHLFSIN